MSEAPSKTRGGRRPGAGRPPTGNAKSIVQERVPPDLAQHCKAAQATTPGYLARLIEKDLEQNKMNKACDNCLNYENDPRQSAATKEDYIESMGGIAQRAAERKAWQDWAREDGIARERAQAEAAAAQEWDAWAGAVCTCSKY